MTSLYYESNKKNSTFVKNPIPHSFMKCYATDIPTEIFANFCEFLPPQDLFSLVPVCKSYRDILYASNSTITEQIWRNSRRTYFPSMIEPPLEGMNEREYTVLLFLQRTCQVCGMRRDEMPVPLHWEFKIRCCEECFEKNVASHGELIKEKTRRPLLSTLPYISKDRVSTHFAKKAWPQNLKSKVSDPLTLTHNRLRIYWRPDVEKLLKRFQALKPKERSIFPDQESKNLLLKMQDFEKRRQAYTIEMKEKKELVRRTRFAREMEAFEREKNSDGTPKYHSPMFGYCQTHQKPLNFFIFTEKDWENWRRQMNKEYYLMMERANSFKPIMCNAL
ncbi:hypothetical protein G9A89_007254 [Geosiphon pyriformis]|nr:hypothetical protein G9A89_007254 [Geosiphon pyriformis]